MEKVSENLIKNLKNNISRNQYIPISVDKYISIIKVDRKLFLVI